MSSYWTDRSNGLIKRVIIAFPFIASSIGLENVVNQQRVLFYKVMPIL